MEKTLTVFTPTFNRAYCLDKCYNSLVNQTSKDFLWLIIDDGSSDNTVKLVDNWILEDKIVIKYIYQENKGMHGAHNAAYENISTSLNVCIDSDDYMPINAVEIILNEWPNIKNNSSCAGIIGLDVYKTGIIIGSKIPNNLKKVKLENLYALHNVTGDKKLVYKTEVIKKYPLYPVFPGEKLVPLSLLYEMIDKDYDLYPINKSLCVVEYQEDGSSLNIFRQYIKNPKGFITYRKYKMKNGLTFYIRFKNACHYVASKLILRDFRIVSTSAKPALAFLAIPFGVLLYFYYKMKVKF